MRIKQAIKLQMVLNSTSWIEQNPDQTQLLIIDISEERVYSKLWS